MRAGPAVLLAFLALAAGPAAAAQEASVAIDFRMPAQANGQVSLAGAEWAVLVFPPSQAAVLDLESPQAARATTHSFLQYFLYEDPIAQLEDSLAVGDPAMELAAGLRLRAEFPVGRWSSLFIEADAIDVQIDQALADLGRVAARSSAAVDQLPGKVPEGTLRLQSPPTVPPDSAVVGLSASSQGMAFLLEATGVRRMEWYNATVSCDGAGDCPDDPAYGHMVLPLRSDDDRVETRNYTELTTQGGRATASGHALLAAVGGSRVDLALQGALRLPGARFGPCGTGCETAAYGTLRAEGDLTLAGLEPQPGYDDRLRGGLGGTAVNAMLDEAPRPGLLGAAAVAGGAALGLAVLAKLVAVLLWRRPREPPQDHPRRQALQQLVAREPGLTFRQVQRQVGWGNGVTRHHLEHLVRTRSIVARPYRNTVRYFENHGRYDSDWEQVVQWRDGEQRWLGEWLAGHGAAGQGEVVRAAAAARGWSRSATQRRLNALVEAGLVRTEPKGRARVYSRA